jgi:hypothetical protein
MDGVGDPPASSNGAAQHVAVWVVTRRSLSVQAFRWGFLNMEDSYTGGAAQGTQRDSILAAVMIER